MRFEEKRKIKIKAEKAEVNKVIEFLFMRLRFDGFTYEVRKYSKIKICKWRFILT
jgi:hypothetical protein